MSFSNNDISYLKELNIQIPSTERLPKSWMGVPMTLGTDILGAIIIQSEQGIGIYNHHQQNLLKWASIYSFGVRVQIKVR